MQPPWRASVSQSSHRSKRARTRALSPRRGQGRPDDEVGEPLARPLERLELQRFLGLEVREQPALAHAGVLGELADGEPGEPDLGGDRDGVVEDRRLRLLALGHATQNRTIVLFRSTVSRVSFVDSSQPSGIPLTKTTLCSRTPDDRQDPVTQTSPAPAPSAVLDESPVESSGQMSHREVLEALSGLLLAMFVAMLSSTVVTNALPRIVERPARQPDRLHLGRRGHAARDDRQHPDLGQARRPVQQEAARPVRARDLHGRVADRGARPEHAGADRRPRRAGARRRRPHRPGPGRHRVDGQPARAWPLLRLHRRDVRAGHRLRPAHRRPDRRLAARLARHLLRRPPDRGRGVRGAPGQAAPAGRDPPGPDRLPRRHAHRRRRQHPARVGVPGRPAVRLDLDHQRR